MSPFTLHLPPSEGFFFALDAVLRIEGQAHVAQLLAGAECSLHGSESQISSPHGYFRATISIAVSRMERLLFGDEIQTEIRRVANQIMPATAGYRVTEIQFHFPGSRALEERFTQFIAQVNELRGSREDIRHRIGRARDLVQATCETILSEKNPALVIGHDCRIPRLLQETQRVLTLVPATLCGASQAATGKILEKLTSLAQNLWEIDLEVRRAENAVWAATILVMYLVDAHRPARGNRWLRTSVS